ncbi:MAG: carbohydrate kinase family protein [Candidatus Nanoarchaeia archaeon]
MFDIIALGSATVDVFADTDSELLIVATNESRAKHICYPSGSKILMKKLSFEIGGGGTNTAVAFSRLGLKTAYLGNLGKDDNAHLITDLLKNEDVDFLGTYGSEKTNYSIILDSIEHDRTILVYRDASDKMLFSKVKKDKLKTKWIYSSSLLGTSYRSLLKLLGYAKQNKVKTAMNISCYQAEQGARKLKPLLDNLDVLIFNKEEAQAMLNTESNDIFTLLKKTRKTGPKVVVITNGSEGAHAFDGKTYYFVKASDIRAVECTGAGDAFASSFVAGLVKGCSIEFAMQLGVANSQSVIRHIGAKNKLLTWNEAVKDIKAYKLKVKKAGLV